MQNVTQILRRWLLRGQDLQVRSSDLLGPRASRPPPLNDKESEVEWDLWSWP